MSGSERVYVGVKTSRGAVGARDGAHAGRIGISRRPHVAPPWGASHLAGVTYRQAVSALTLSVQSGASNGRLNFASVTVAVSPEFNFVCVGGTAIRLQ